jgi:hypothetical protein
VKYTGSLIENLFATVERAEAQARTENDMAELERWYAASHSQAAQVEPDLLGVA